MCPLSKRPQVTEGKKCHTLRLVSHRQVLVKASSNSFVQVPAAVESLKDKQRTLEVSNNGLAEFPGMARSEWLIGVAGKVWLMGVAGSEWLIGVAGKVWLMGVAGKVWLMGVAGSGWPYPSATHSLFCAYAEQELVHSVSTRH